MAYRKKSTAPDYYWCFYLNELVELSTARGGGSDEAEWYERLLGRWSPPRCLYLVDFCTVYWSQPPQLTVGDFVNGTWLQKLKNFALAWIFYKYAEEY